MNPRTPLLSPETVAVHPWATPEGRRRAHRTLNAPLYLSTQWEGESLAEMSELFLRHPERGFYTRFGHPTTGIAEHTLAALDGAESALCFGSGMAAITSSLITVLEAGDHVVAHQAIFAQTVQFLELLSRDFGVSVTFVDATEPENVAAALRTNTRVLYLETPSNPLIDILDISWLAALARDAGALVFVDSTFAGPLLQQPLALGASLALQSASKSLGGHADVMAGVAAGSAELIARVRKTRVLLGGVLDPHASWLLLRGIQTLPLRVRAACDTAAAVVGVLERSPLVSQLRYPFSASHPGHAVARRQMKAGGGMVSFALHGGVEATRRFVRGLEWIALASSLGSVFTTLEVPDELDFAPEEIGERSAAFALPPGFMRLSIGTEATADVVADIERGLRAAG